MTIWLHLDAQGRLPAPPDELSPTRKLGYRALGGPAIPFPIDTEAIDWEAVHTTIRRMAAAIRDEDPPPDIVVGGKAPLPVFADLGLELQPWTGKHQVLANQRKDKQWDVIDLSRNGGPLFDVVEGVEGSNDAGIIAVFVSVMGGPAPEARMQQYLDQMGRPCAGMVTVRTSSRTILDSHNGPGAAFQLTELVSQLAVKFPRQSGIALFVAGPATLAFMAGRAVNPNMFAELHLPNFHAGSYLRAIIGQPRHSWRWDFFLAHASPDAAVAERLYDALVNKGHRVFLDRRSLLPGEDWDRAIPDAQRTSRVTIMLVSARTGSAFYERNEIVAAIQLARTGPHHLVPVLLPGHDPDRLPYGLHVKQAITVDDPADLEPVADQLVDVLRRLGDEA